MRENLTQAEIERAFRAALLSCMGEYGRADVPVLQHYDYLKKGRRDEAVYFTVLNPQRLGYAHRSYSPALGLAGHKEHQHMQVDIAVTVISDDDPLELAMLVTTVAGSLPFIERMRAEGLGVQATSNMTTVHAKDDRDNYALECSFSIPVTFNRSVAPVTPSIEVADLNIHRV